MMTWFENLKKLWHTIGASISQAHDHVDRFEQAGVTGSPALAFMKLAVQQAEAGDLDVALQNFQQALIIEPERADIHANLGIVLAKAGRLEEAESRFSFACEVEPQRAIYYVLWGACLVDLGDLDKACVQYETAIALKPRHVEPWINWALALSRAGHTEEALLKLKQVLQFSPSHPQAFYLWGAILAEKKQYQDAFNKLNTCLKYEAHHTDALLLSAVLQRKLGHPEAAIALLETLQSLLPDKPEALHVWGECYLSLNQLPQAQAYIEEALFLRPDSPEILLSQARLLDAQGRVHLALSLLEGLDAQGPPPKELFQVWADVLVRLGDFPQALKVLNKQATLSLDEEEALVYFKTRLTVLSRLGTKGAFKQSLSEAQARFPTERGFQFAQACLLVQEGRYSEALIAFRDVSETTTEFKEAPLNVGLLLLQCHHLEEALRYLRVLYRQNPSDSLTITCYALAQLASEQEKDAFSKLEALCTQAKNPPLEALSAWVYATALWQPEALEALLGRYLPLEGEGSCVLHWQFAQAVAYYVLHQPEDAPPRNVGSLHEASQLWQGLQGKVSDLKGHSLEAWKDVSPWHLWVLHL
jgi:tetratricopeptide (TPR) repeat protein